MSSMNGGAAIVGASETEIISKMPDTPILEIHAEAARRALADAGLTIADVDGIATAGRMSVEVAHYLGVQPRWIDGTSVGGCSFMLHVRHAAMAIACGAADVVLITHGESGRSRAGEPKVSASPVWLPQQFELPYGAARPVHLFTTPALRWLRDRGLGVSSLAEPVVAQREWAVGNPRALRRDPITVDEVLADREVVWPFTLSMCCLVADGGGALVMTSASRANDLDLNSRPVYLLGSGEACESTLVEQMGDLTSFGAFRRASAEAFRTADLSPADIDHLMVYDAFAHLPLYGLEDLGFVGRGDSASFIADGHTRPGGSLPMNTNGGGMSYTHTGMYGMFAILEAVRQLRGTAAVQVPGVRTSFVQGVGMFFGAAGSLILGNE